MRFRAERLLTILAPALVAAGLGFGSYWYYYHSTLFDFLAVELRRNWLVDEADVASVFTKHVGEDILSVDIDAAARELGALPWVKSAAVLRKFSGTMDVVLSEYRPGYILEDTEGTAFYVSADGIVVELVNESVQDKLAYRGIQLARIGTERSIVPGEYIEQTPLLYSLAESVSSEILSRYRVMLVDSGIKLAGEYAEILIGRAGFPLKAKVVRAIEQDRLSVYQGFRARIGQSAVYIQENMVSHGQRDERTQ